MQKFFKQIALCLILKSIIHIHFLKKPNTDLEYQCFILFNCDYVIKMKTLQYLA